MARRKNHPMGSAFLSKIKKQYIKVFILLLILLITLVRFKKIFLWLVLSFGAAFIKYWRCRYYGHIPIVFEPVLFVATVLTRGYGIKWSLLFLLGPNIIFELMSGGMQFALFIGFIQFSFYQVINLLLFNYSIVYVGILICLIDIVVAHLQNTYIWGLPPFQLIYPVSNFVTHLIYFTVLGEPVVALLQAVS
ncbi:hypothetical protein GF327_02045 [Candidatus Woesearchaeota archaeon]|nr:hypothetical protein [Candidatus Woesearchaeota archaeon]